MNDIDLNKIKYYPDRFYMCLDGFDLKNLTTFITDLQIGQHQSIFIHEYYHYLTNITTFAGIRQFHLNFCDRFRLITIMSCYEGLNAFPIGNPQSQSPNEVELWNSVAKILDDDDINYDLVRETEQSSRKKFNISSTKATLQPIDAIYAGTKFEGARELIEIEITGLTNITSFTLTFGALDEFLSSSIDEYLFENDLSDIDHSALSQRPFYPYRFFDELLLHYNIQRPSAFEKIILVYFALNSYNPPKKLITILEKLRDRGYEKFQENPESYLLQYLDPTLEHDNMLFEIEKFANETMNLGKIHISQALRYYRDKFYSAKKFKDSDFFYFIRPFFEKDDDKLKEKQKFLLAFSRILNQFTPPVILENGAFRTVDKLTTFGESTLLILATYEIFESLKNNRLAMRPAYLKAKYIFPDKIPNGDDVSIFSIPIDGITFQLALNELSLFGLYIEDFNKDK